MSKSIMFTARISDEVNEFLMDLGGGNRTKGFERLVDQAMGVSSKPVAPVRAETPRASRPASAPIKQAQAAVRKFVGKAR